MAPTTTGDTVCSGCGKPVDSLRAGHVAILGGRFRYYCDASCKAVHLREVAASVLSGDQATAEPPAVALGPRPSFPMAPEESLTPPPARVASPPLPDIASADETHEGDDEDQSAEDLSEPEAVAAAADAALAVASAPSLPSLDDAETVPLAPTQETDEAPAPVAAAAPPALSARVLEPLAIAGLAAGALTPLTTLASVEIVRLPLALFAAFAAAARVSLRRREPADVPAALTAVPTLALAAVAIAASAAGKGAAVATVLGLSAAAALLVDLLVVRARQGLDAFRDKTARDLDVVARVVRVDSTEETTAAVVRPGETLRVEAGDVVGADGVVVAGEAEVIPWIDAPIQMKKREGDTVVAGARVVSGALRLNVTWAREERAWARLALSPLLRVDVAAPQARMARLAALRGVPAIALVAGAAAFAQGGSLVDAVVVACAAALGLGAVGTSALVSLAHAEGYAKALRHGIVFKDAAGFDRAGTVDVAVVCCRGTLLMGEPEIVATESLGSLEPGRILQLAAGAEAASTHPFAAAVLRHARAEGESPENVRNATAHSGLGVTALAPGGERIVVGNRSLLLAEKVSVAIADARIAELEAQGRSVLIVALAGKVVGLIALQDGLRPGARAAVQRLHEARVEPILLSGESRETCETIGRALEVDHVRPEVLPAERGAEVRALAEGGHVVAVLGHPQADDSALGAADVAVALGAAGASPGEWTVQTASDDVRDAVLALTLARATRERSRRAMVVGLLPSAVALLAVVFGLVPAGAAPVAAAIGAILAARTQ